MNSMFSPRCPWYVMSQHTGCLNELCALVAVPSPPLLAPAPLPLTGPVPLQTGCAGASLRLAQCLLALCAL